MTSCLWLIEVSMCGLLGPVVDFVTTAARGNKEYPNKLKRQENQRGKKCKMVGLVRPTSRKGRTFQQLITWICSFNESGGHPKHQKVVRNILCCEIR